MTPMMAGLLITSIASGQLISRFGHYKPFPILGTAIASLGLLLLSRLQPETSTVTAGVYMLVLGLGLGLVMQVLTVVAQNSVDYKQIGVATAGVTLLRQVGGCAIKHLPAAAHYAYAHALTGALHPVFLAAAGILAGAFVLACLLPELPLRTTAGAPSADVAYESP